MFRRLFLGGCVFLLTGLTIFFTGCGPDKIDVSQQRIINYTLDSAEAVSFQMNANTSTGYDWKWMNEEKAQHVRLSAKSYRTKSWLTDGGGGKELWEFYGIKPGIDTVELHYQRPGDDDFMIDVKKLILTVE